MKKVYIYTFALFLPIVILLLSFNSSVYNLSLIEKQQKKLDIYQVVDQQRSQEQTKNLIYYLQNKENLNKSFYTTREILHLGDVKNLFKNIKIISFISYAILIILAIYIYTKNSWEKLLKLSLKSLSYLFILYLVVLAISQLFFNQIFIFFHKISFNNDLWLLDPLTEKLVVIFPQEFFLNMTEFILVKSLVIAILTAGLIFGVLKMGKKRKI